jgi:hypothetical protein
VHQIQNKGSTSSVSDSSLDEEEYFNHTYVAQVENECSCTRLFTIVVTTGILLFKISQYNSFMNYHQGIMKVRKTQDGGLNCVSFFFFLKLSPVFRV